MHQLARKSLPAKIFSVAVLFVCATAQAKPPENADGTYAEFFHSLRQPGTGVPCCDMSDCRRTASRRSADGRMQFYIGKQQFQDNRAPDDFVTADPKNEITDPAIKNPFPNDAVVCWAEGKAFCYVLPVMSMREYHLAKRGNMCVRKPNSP